MPLALREPRSERGVYGCESLHFNLLPSELELRRLELGIRPIVLQK